MNYFDERGTGPKPIRPVGPADRRIQLRDSVAAHIRELIVAGRVQPGELLRLEPLAAEVDASVTPVREALLLLAQDEWVILEPNRGFRVATIGRSNVLDAYLVHAFVSGELAARAALKISAEEVADLRALDVRMRTARPDEPHRLDDLNHEFHRVVYASAESPRLSWFVDAAARYVPRRYWATIPGWLEMNSTDHSPITDALERGDADVARALMASHIKRAGSLLVDHLDEIGFWESHVEALAVPVARTAEGADGRDT